MTAKSSIAKFPSIYSSKYQLRFDRPDRKSSGCQRVNLCKRRILTF